MATKIGDPQNIGRLPPDQHALNMGAAWLSEYNDAEAAGNTKRAAMAYRKSQWWLDKYNDLVGDGDGRRRR